MSSVPTRRPVSPLVETWIGVLLDGRGFSPATVVSYRAVLADFQARMDLNAPELATTPMIDRYRTRLALAGMSWHTRRMRMATLRSFFKFLKGRGYIESDPAAVVELPQARTLNSLPIFREWEIERLVAHLPPSPHPRGKREPKLFYDRRLAAALLAESRDPALFALIYATGLRAGEVALLERDDYDGKEIDIRGAKRATEPQVLEVMKRARLELALYLDVRDQSPWADHPALFPPPFDRQNRSHAGCGISADAVARILEGRIRLVGIDPKRRRLSPHVFRYSVATHFYERGYPIPEIQRMLRHRALATTMRYVNLGRGTIPRPHPFRPHPWISGRSFSVGPSPDSAKP